MGKSIGKVDQSSVGDRTMGRGNWELERECITKPFSDNLATLQEIKVVYNTQCHNPMQIFLCNMDQRHRLGSPNTDIGSFLICITASRQSNGIHLNNLSEEQVVESIMDRVMGKIMKRAIKCNIEIKK